MKQKTGNNGGLWLLAGATVMLLLLFARLYVTINPRLEQADEHYARGLALNIRAGLDRDSLFDLLADGNYYTDLRDVSLIADSLAAKLVMAPSIENFGSINKQDFFIKAPLDWNSTVGGTDFKNRLHASRRRLGFDSLLYAQELSGKAPASSTPRVGTGLQITGQVIDPANGDLPMSGILVQLKKHSYKAAGVVPETGRVVRTGDGGTSLSFPEDEGAGEPEEEAVYTRTGADGKFSFGGLFRDSGYSVVPLKPGFEFGTREGSEALRGSVNYTFRAGPHQVRLIGPIVYGQLKADKVFTVRTPGEFRFAFWTSLGIFMLAFWTVFGFWMLRRFHPDPFLLPVIMLLTGISLLVLFSIQDPLQDTLYGSQAVQGIAFGLAGFAVFSQFDPGRWYSKWWFDGFFNFKKRSFYNLPGWTWLVLAVLVALITVAFGSGPEGSGVRVNLQLGGVMFQPSEITKYLLLVFFAAFFAANEERIRNLSDMRWRFLVNWGVMAGAGIILLLYLLMGDMGPALVVCFTFLLFYSIARQNLLITVLSGFTYGLLLWTIPDNRIATLVAIVALIAFMLWQGSIRSSKWYGWAGVLVEPPLILILVIAAFSFGDQVPAVGERLAARKDMWLNQWNNDVYGGDHLAHSFWTLSSGGFRGQGLGRGFANTMPAAHTDMILPSIGEELGWLGLIAVFLLFGVLIHRVFLHARRAGQPFTFYLCAGIAIAAGVQFLLIAGGSIGLIPLTGVAVPFLSYGKISMMINLAALGLVAGISARPGHEVQKEYIRNHYDPVLIAGISCYLLGIFVLIVQLSSIQLWLGREYIVRPARVINRNGLPVYSYNPRIELLTRELAAGTIYDRNHLVLATSDPEALGRNMDSLYKTSLNARRLQQLATRKLRSRYRYYPFEQHLFFWVGDFNTRFFWGQSNGYYAEAAHLSELRGFDTKPHKTTFVTTRYRANRFLKPVEKSVVLVSYDYSSLATMLRSGIDSTNPEIKALRSKNRDVQLTIDARLQTYLQAGLGEDPLLKDNRVSVVVMEDLSGDVLASAAYPLPLVNDWETMSLTDSEQSGVSSWVTNKDLGFTHATQPGSTAKIVTALAALNKHGTAITTKPFFIREEDRIRTGGNEPDETGNIYMEQAIVKSNNPYFIRLANEEYLEEEMATIYLKTGMFLRGAGGYFYHPKPENTYRQNYVRDLWRNTEFTSRKIYDKTDLRKTSSTGISGMAWGQGQLVVTPASMARVAAGVANNGSMVPDRYVLKIGDSAVAVQPAIPLANDPKYARLLTGFMLKQSANKVHRLGVTVAGKTGTPQREFRKQLIYDGWYVFFVPRLEGKGHIVACVRIEDCTGSGEAVDLAGRHLIPLLKKMEYIK